MTTTAVRRPPLRRLHRRPPSKRPILLSFVALAACLGLLSAASAGVFRVRHIEVVGANVPPAAVIQAAGVMGSNIFTVRSDLVAKRLTAIHQIVVNRVDTGFPDRVTVYATARIPVIAWRTPSGLFEIDATGAIVRQVQQTTLPVVVSHSSAQIPTPGVVQAVIYAGSTLSITPDGEVIGYLLQRNTGLTIQGKSGWTADVGQGKPQTMINRIGTLVAFLGKVHGQPRHLLFVDLRFRVPYARFAAG